MSDVDDALAAQIAYYRRRADQYDDDLYADEAAVVGAYEKILDRLARSGDALEIGCGTGLWTRLLLPSVNRLTALDAAPEMIRIATDRVGDATVRFVIADVFVWTPDQRFDTVFMGFWLSHVPPPLFERFWASLAGMLRPDGRVFFVDTGPGERPNETVHDDPRVPTVSRRLRDGSEHRVVKVFHAPAILAAALAELGWESQVGSVGPILIAGTAQRHARLPQPWPAVAGRRPAASYGSYTCLRVM
jgi:demethylmenaquinone methyltransferase/2-methoxy-6-polyprenyl-1,4-benzoquinol methylase